MQVDTVGCGLWEYGCQCSECQFTDLRIAQYIYMERAE